MNKVVPAVILAVLVVGLGLLAWWVTRDKPADPKPGEDPEIVTQEFKAQDFIPTFDLNEDGRVTYEEFAENYGKPWGEQGAPLIFYEDDGGPALGAREAFNRWDRNGDGVVDVKDLKDLRKKIWDDYVEKATERGLLAVSHNGYWMMLNEHQSRVYEREKGALANNEVPWAGAFWDRKYFAQWGVVMDDQGDSQEGYIWDNVDRVYLVTTGAKMYVFDTAKVDVIKAPEDEPYNQYGSAIVKTSFDDVQANLELARKCVEWGMEAEAGALYSRVLVFERTNQEALDALGLIETDGKFTERDE